MKHCGSLALFITLLAPSLLAQQKTTNTTTGQCSPIIANNPGHVVIRCSGLTKEQQDILANIPNLLNQVLAKQLSASEAKKLFKGIDDQLADIKSGVQQLQDRPEDPNRGILVPANDPNPVNSSPGCDTKAVGSFRLYLGSYMIISPGFRETAIDLRGKAVLSFTKHNGSLGISASVNGPDGKEIAFLKDGYFKLDQYFRKELPDRSTLNVYNQTDDTPVLHIRYLNDNAVQVTGKFFNEGAALDITDNTFQILHNGVPSMTFQGGCGYAPPAYMPNWGNALFTVF
jgi:hypothetical protein